VKKTKTYRPQLWLAWVLLLVATGLMTTVREDSPIGHIIGFSSIAAVGIGILVTTTYFPVLAPRKHLHVGVRGGLLTDECFSVTASKNGPALAYFMFLRNFAQVRCRRVCRLEHVD
jgi:hypothetical protein